MKMKTADYFFRFPFHIFFLLLFLFTRFFSVPFVQIKKKKLKQRITVLVVSLSILSFNSFFLLLFFFPASLTCKEKKNQMKTADYCSCVFPLPFFLLSVHSSSYSFFPDVPIVQRNGCEDGSADGVDDTRH